MGERKFREQREDDGRELFFERRNTANGTVYVPFYGESVGVPTSNGYTFFCIRQNGNEWTLTVKSTGRPIKRTTPIASRMDAIMFAYTVAETVWKRQTADIDNYFDLVFDMAAIRQYAEWKRVTAHAIPLSALRA